MADNALKYGFRLVRMRGGFAHANSEEALIATGAAFNVTAGAQNASLRPGDPVVMLSTGTVGLAPGTEGTPGDIWGIVVGVKQYLDVARNAVTALGNAVPSGLAYGTNLDLQTKVYVIPAEAGVWAVQVNNNTTATTKAGYQAFIGENANQVLTGAASQLLISPKLDIATHATTATLQWRIVGLASDAFNFDYTGNNVELEVICNRAQRQTGAGTMFQGI